MTARVLIVALAVGLLVAAEKPKDEGAKKNPLEGTWEVVTATSDGKDSENAKGDTLVFKGTKVTHKAKDGDHGGTIKIDAKKKTLDFTPSEGEQKDMVFKGIYELKKNELKICIAFPGADRPTDFTSAEGSKRILAVLKRASD
jgi:uncharacterized protein (TIGR03067 family)